MDMGSEAEESYEDNARSDENVDKDHRLISSLNVSAPTEQPDSLKRRNDDHFAQPSLDKEETLSSEDLQQSKAYSQDTVGAKTAQSTSQSLCHSRKPDLVNIASWNQDVNHIFVGGLDKVDENKMAVDVESQHIFSTDSDEDDLLEILDSDEEEEEHAYLLYPNLAIGPQTYPRSSRKLSQHDEEDRYIHPQSKQPRESTVLAPYSTRADSLSVLPNEASHANALMEVERLARTFERASARHFQSPFLAGAGDRAQKEMEEREKCSMVRYESRQKANAIELQRREKERLRLFWNSLYGLALFFTLAAVVLSAVNGGAK